MPRQERPARFLMRTWLVHRQISPEPDQGLIEVTGTRHHLAGQLGTSPFCDDSCQGLGNMFVCLGTTLSQVPVRVMVFLIPRSSCPDSDIDACMPSSARMSNVESRTPIIIDLRFRLNLRVNQATLITLAFLIPGKGLSYFANTSAETEPRVPPPVLPLGSPHSRSAVTSRTHLPSHPGRLSRRIAD
ncbi:unnamed protein product [Penicillium bialowiezense]